MLLEVEAIEIDRTTLGLAEVHGAVSDWVTDKSLNKRRDSGAAAELSETTENVSWKAC